MYDRANTREAIRNAAVDLMFERGYHGTSLRDVAKVVGVQMSSLYHHHASKQALLVDIMRTTMTDLIAVVGDAIESAEGPRARLTCGMRAHVMFHAERRKENFIADSEIRSLEEERPAIVALRDVYERLFIDVLEEGRASGAFDVADVRVALSALLATTNGVATWFRPEGRLSLSAVADEYCALLLDGIAAPGAGFDVDAPARTTG